MSQRTTEIIISQSKTYLDLIKDTYTRMKCSKCGYERDAPDWVLGEFRGENITKTNLGYYVFNVLTLFLLLNTNASKFLINEKVEKTRHTQVFLLFLHILFYLTTILTILFLTTMTLTMFFPSV